MSFSHGFAIIIADTFSYLCCCCFAIHVDNKLCPEVLVKRLKLEVVGIWLLRLYHVPIFRMSRDTSSRSVRGKVVVLEIENMVGQVNHKIVVTETFVHIVSKGFDTRLNSSSGQVGYCDMLDGRSRNYITGLREDPKCHVTSNSMGNTKPSAYSCLFVSHVHFLLIPIPDNVIKIKVKPFGDIDCVTSDTFNSRSTIMTARENRLNLRDVYQTVISQTGGNLILSHPCLPFGFNLLDFGFRPVILCDAAALLCDL